MSKCSYTLFLNRPYSWNTFFGAQKLIMNNLCIKLCFKKLTITKLQKNYTALTLPVKLVRGSSVVVWLDLYLFQLLVELFIGHLQILCHGPYFRSINTRWSSSPRVCFFSMACLRMNAFSMQDLPILNLLCSSASIIPNSIIRTNHVCSVRLLMVYDSYTSMGSKTSPFGLPLKVALLLITLMFLFSLSSLI